MTGKKERNLQIDGVRLLFILAVVFYHYTRRFTEQYGVSTIDFPGLDKLGAVAVGGFFILAGYFLMPRKTDGFRLRDYYLKRFIRLFPAYFLCITLIYISVHIFGLPGREVSFQDYLLNIPFLNGVVGKPYVDGAHWFMTYIIIFTILAGIITKLKIPAKVYLPVWLLMQITFKVVLVNVGSNFWLKQGYKMIGGDYVVYIVAGIALAQIMKEGLSQKCKNMFGAIMLVALGELIFIKSFIFALATLVVFVIIILAIFKKLAVLEKIKFLGKLGESSYILYLIHQNIGYQIILALVGFFGPQYAIWYGLGAMLSMMGISYVIHKLYEAPLQQKCLKLCLIGINK